MVRKPRSMTSKDDAMNNCSHLDEMFVSTTKTVTQESSKKKDFWGNFSQHGGGGSQSPNFISTVQKKHHKNLKIRRKFQKSSVFFWRLHSLAALPAESSPVGDGGELCHDASAKIHDGEVCQQVGKGKLHNSQGEKVEQVEEPKSCPD